MTNRFESEMRVRWGQNRGRSGEKVKTVFVVTSTEKNFQNILAIFHQKEIFLASLSNDSQPIYSSNRKIKRQSESGWFLKLLNYCGSARHYLWSFRKPKSTTMKKFRTAEGGKGKLSMVENQSKFHDTFMNFLHGVFNPFAVSLRLIFHYTRKQTQKKRKNYCHVLRRNLYRNCLFHQLRQFSVETSSLFCPQAMKMVIRWLSVTRNQPPTVACTKVFCRLDLHRK